MRITAACVALSLLAGCVGSSVRKGVAIGAVSGAAAGAGVGLLISDDALLGSEATSAKGDTSLATGETMAASALIGVVFGAIVGGMVGHVHEPRFGRDLSDTAEGEAAPGAEDAPVEEQSRAPALLRF